MRVKESVFIHLFIQHSGRLEDTAVPNLCPYGICTLVKEISNLKCNLISCLIQVEMFFIFNHGFRKHSPLKRAIHSSPSRPALAFLMLGLLRLFWDCPLHPGGFPHGWDSKESTCNAGDLASIPGSGRSPGGGHGNPLQYSCLENPMDWGAWWATVHRVAQSQTWLSN